MDPVDPNQELVTKFQNFLKQETSQEPKTVEEEKPLSSSYDWLGGEGEPEVPVVQTSPPTVSEPAKPEASFYDKMGNYIESKPELRDSFNSWYSENVLGVKKAAPPVTQPGAQVDPKVIHEQWMEAYQADPVSTTVELFNRLGQNNQKALLDQFQGQLKPLMDFVSKTMRTSFETSLATDETYKQVKPIYDNIVANVTPAQIQQNPEILNALYNVAVGQAYRDGKLSGKTSSPPPAPLNPIPGVNMGPPGKRVSELTREERALLSKYSNDISYDDYIKYGGS